MPALEGISPSIGKTAIDEVLYTEFDRAQEPQEVLATNNVFFYQQTTDKGAVIEEEYSNVGGFTEHIELQDTREATVKTGNQKTHPVNKYQRGVKISRELYDDDQHNFVDETIRQFGLRAALSRDKFAFKYTYQDAFSTTTMTTPDGYALCSDTHLTLNGDTVDNSETGAISPANLATYIKNLRVQKAQDGELGGHNAAGLLVPPDKFDEACEYCKSEQKANTTDNNINFISLIYPGMVIGTSAYLDSTYNTLNSNTNTSYFIVSRNHKIKRVVREALSTKLLSPEDIEGDYWYYSATFREAAYPATWEGVIGSTGTA